MVQEREVTGFKVTQTPVVSTASPLSLGLSHWVLTTGILEAF